MLKENNMVASHYEDGVYEERFQGEDRTVVVKTVGYTGWKIVSVTPADRLFQDFNRTEIMAVIIIILAVCLMIFANQFVAVRIVKPLKKLEKFSESYQGWIRNLKFILEVLRKFSIWEIPSVLW